MTITIKKWVYLFTLSIIWGSSYILIKKGLVGLTPLQLGSTRIVMTNVILMIFGRKQLRKIPKEAWKWIILTGFFGTFFPSYLFAFAETVIDSSVAAVLNGMTPLFTLILGLLFFNSNFKWMKIVGVLVGFGGTLILVSNEFTMRSGLSSWYAFLVMAATLCYSINVNLIKHKLQGVPALAIALGNFIAIVIPAFGVLLFTDFPWTKITSSPEVSSSIGYILILSLFGTALAKVMFNELVSISTAVFSISITYLLPIVAIAWGILDGEKFTLIQWLGCALILLGVYVITDKKRPKDQAS
ncbi:MAG: permease [Flavobacteriaceae bacterium TMED48]|jgi:drug/metabolite transporter (DMT)-like permease|nr:MAG: permease [Flavobacteriaceae bacterium TMED48]|tara:strand:+ start:3287 stop:4183 length:897 start_codon:yes stop_codon:yes gene_type:complete